MKIIPKRVREKAETHGSHRVNNGANGKYRENNNRKKNKENIKSIWRLCSRVRFFLMLSKILNDIL